MYLPRTRRDAPDIRMPVLLLSLVRTKSSQSPLGETGTGGVLVCPGRGNGVLYTSHHFWRGMEGIRGGCALGPRVLRAALLGHHYEQARPGPCPYKAHRLMWEPRTITNHDEKVQGRIYRAWRARIRQMVCFFKRFI